MDAALLVEEKSAGVDETNGTPNAQSLSRLDLSDLGEMEDCEECQKDGEEMEMDEKDRPIGRAAVELKMNESDETIPENYGQELKEENNTSQEVAKDMTPQVTSALNLQQKKESADHERTELQQKEIKLDDSKKNEEEQLDEKNMEEMDFEMVNQASEMDEEMKQQTSELYQEPTAAEVKEKDKQDGLVGTAASEVQDVTSTRRAEIEMEVSNTEEKKAEVDAREPFVNVVSVSAKAKSPFDEKSFDLASKSSSQDSENLSKTENQANQDLKGCTKEPPAQTLEQTVQPETEDETTTPESPLVKIKDEPMDEEYEKAFGPQATAEKIKDEPDTSEEFGQKSSEQIKISAVFSVSGSAAALDSPAVVPASSAPPSTLAPNPTPSSAGSLCVVCSGCTKILLKGQTAFQRKGSTQLYCSPRCLCSSTSTESVIVAGSKKTCHHCHKGIPNTKDVIAAPVDSTNAVKDFCSQKCVAAFNNKKDCANSAFNTKCIMCQKSCAIRHEVNFMGSIHKLCSDPCFQQFRISNKLSMNCCVTCGSYCNSNDGKSQSLLIDNTTKNCCSQKCLSTFIKTYTKPVPCSMCRVNRNGPDMLESVNKKGHTELFCSTACMTAHKVQTVTSSGSAVECNFCKTVRVPQFHLAMSDGTIRNFCSFTCVISFQDIFNKKNTQSNQINVAPSLSMTQLKSTTPTVQSVSAESSSHNLSQIPSVTRFSCVHCLRSFLSRPELLEFKGKMFVFCDKTCTDEFRRTHYVLAPCVYCKIEKVVKEVKRINNVDCSFCSEGCKLLYKHDLARHWGKRHCRNCLYCSSTTQTVMTSIFSGKQEEFCGNECLSQYTLLFCEVAKCSMCKRARKMTETVKWLNEMKHFCNLKCLMHFCGQQAGSLAALVTPVKPAVTQASTVPISIAPSAHSTITNVTTPSLVPTEATPVIASVISLSNATNGQPSVLASSALPGTVPTVVKLLGHASTQTESVKPPSAPPRILKNKALLCKPLSQNKGTSCKPNTTDTNTQTDESLPKVIVLPVPVPVFCPVPMHLYTQYTPQPFGFPFPVPVPMFLPTTLDSAERIVETIQMIKERIPDNPLEADLIMMADMVAEDSEKDKAVSQGDQDDNFIEDFDLDALSSHLSWEDDSISSTSRWGRSSESEKVALSRQEQSPSPPPAELQMDLEADFPVGTFEHLEHHAQEDKTSTTTKPKLRRSTRECMLQKRRTRRHTEALRSPVAKVQNLTKLHTEYGVQAWKSWVRWRDTQPNVELPKFGSRNITLKEDLLQCSTAELSYGLCKFITEVRRPNGEIYSPDSMYYLCLGIQQYLFENSRMENIFTDLFYTKFSQTMSSLLKGWKPTLLPSGCAYSRVEEDYLWECKQLGAFSPSVLLNTLLYFCTKFFNFKTVAQHRRLSFAHIMRCNRPSSNGNKKSCLRFYPPVRKDNQTDDELGVPAKRKKEDEEDEGVVLEMQENAENPLHCPVRLYEFYLSKCSSMVKQRTSVFYLRPERSCVPNSPLWFSQVSLDDEELESMLLRILTVREIHVERETPVNMSEPENQTDSE